MDGADETRESQHKLPVPDIPEGVPRLDNIAYVFVFLGSIICRSYKLTLSDRTQVSRQLTVTFSVNIFNRYAVAVGPENFSPTGVRRHFQRPLQTEKT